MPVITLTTEWRPDDIYNGIIKGKLCSLCPGAVIIDNAGNIPPFDISHASFVIRNTFENYPKGSIHIICIHSEAHKGEDYLLVKAREHYFIGTDNGIFNLILNSDPDEIIRIGHEDSENELDIFVRAASELFAGKDPAQIGTPLKAQILAARPGHASNIEFARMIRKLYQQKKLIRKYQHERKEGVVFDINAIKRILPHRYPFLLVDKIIDFKMDESIVGVKNVTVNEPFFEGHFPGQPVMPGVLILEAMAQTGGILLLNGIENPEGKLVYFMSIDKAKFRRPVTPGDQLVLTLTMTTRKSKICVMAGKAYVGGTLVAEAEMMASIIERPGVGSNGNGTPSA